jgi:hypothetical protein
MEPPTGLLPKRAGLRTRRFRTAWQRSHRSMGIGSLKEGDLAKVGYKATLKAPTRRRAVDKAVKTYGKVSALRKLNAVAVYTKRRSPARSRTFKSDVRYIQKKYFGKK